MNPRVLSFALAGIPSLAPAIAQEQAPVAIMSFNVENLFDAVDDPANPGYATYLPYSEKGTAAHEAICTSFGHGGPDILVLREVENPGIVERLNAAFLGEA